MSRSRKKTPWSGDNKGKENKRLANAAVRSWEKQHLDEILPPGGYKKIYETWDICDYGWIRTWEEYWQSCIDYWERFEKQYGKPFPDKKREYRQWLKWYQNK